MTIKKIKLNKTKKNKTRGNKIKLKKIKTKRNKKRNHKKRNHKKSTKNKTYKSTKNKTYKSNDFKSGDGMLTGVWGPALWHYLHILSFNFPVNPTKQDKIHYKNFIVNLKHTLPCKYCRNNLKKNLKMLPLKNSDLENRDKFSRWVYKLHELINTMLGKRSNLSFCDVRERYEHFRSRCTIEKNKIDFKKLKKQFNKTKKKEKGCTEPLYGKKSKCIVKIVPENKRLKSFQMDKKCIKIR
tara:strand:- start:1822 stop:2541 length:720 start_codon:yes stop_codon:yes gene_type:complete